MNYSVSPQPIAHGEYSPQCQLAESGEPFLFAPSGVWEFLTIADGLSFLDITISTHSDFAALEFALASGGCWIRDSIGVFVVEQAGQEHVRFSRWQDVDARRQRLKMVPRPVSDDGILWRTAACRSDPSV